MKQRLALCLSILLLWVAGGVAPAAQQVGGAGPPACCHKACCAKKAPSNRCCLAHAPVSHVAHMVAVPATAVLPQSFIWITGPRTQLPVPVLFYQSDWPVLRAERAPPLRAPPFLLA